MKNQRRGKNVALVGLGLQVLGTVLVVVLWQWTNSRALLTLLWLLLAGVPLWLMTTLLFYVQQLHRQEELELEELAGRSGGSTIFDEDAREQLHAAQRRLRTFRRWIVPLFTLLLAGYHAALGLLLLRVLGTGSGLELTATGPAALFLLLAFVLMILFSRYCTGMGTRSDWRPLRTTGSYTLLCSLAMLAVVVALGFDSQGYLGVEPVIAYLLPIVQLLLAVELLLNLVLDIYRPRQPDEEYRPSYDSRILNLLAEPSRVGHGIAETINYQFGFEVSSTWFYQLVSRAIVPLILFGVVVMFLLSGVVVVTDGQQCILKRWGVYQRTVGPGVHVKWPWPIATAERYKTEEIQELVIGVGEEREQKRTRDGQTMLLWTEEHGYQGRLERDFLIAVPPRERSRQDALASAGPIGAPPSVSIIKLVLTMQYRVTDPYKYAYTYTDPLELIRCVTDQEMVRYCASATLDEITDEDDTDRPQALLTLGRDRAAAELQRRVQQRLNQLDLGVNVVFLGIVSAHPPAEAVPDFEAVLEAERLQDKQRYEAQAQANQILAAVAGDPDDALQLYLALRREEVFEGLAKRIDDPAGFKPVVEEYIRRAMSQIDALELELRRERLLGKDADTLQSRTRLLEGYRAFVADLERAGGNPKTFDYATTIASARRDVESLFDRLEGEPAVMLAEARADRWETELRALTAVLEYHRKLLPFQAAPRVYLFNQYMDVLDETLPNLMKYVIGVDRDRLEVRVNLEQQRDLLGEATQIIEEAE